LKNIKFTLNQNSTTMRKIVLFISCSALLLSCTMNNTSQSIEKWKAEVVATEQQFAQMAKTDGLKNAFLAFAAPNVVIMRNNSLVKGKSEMALYFDKQNIDPENISLQWQPDFVDVSASGDMAYTYGEYTFSVKDSIGNITQSKGIFHTVWKKQPDGKWRFVWD